MIHLIIILIIHVLCWKYELHMRWLFYFLQGESKFIENSFDSSEDKIG